METCLQLRQAIGFAMRGKADIQRPAQPATKIKHIGFLLFFQLPSRGNFCTPTNESLKSEYQYMGVS